MDIYKLLTSKTHNKHYLNRYYKFITQCQAKNGNYITGELHHICPKAKDLFPEYKDLRTNIWNKSYLTLRQHLLAHWMLWKAYGGSQTFSFYAMNNQNHRRDRNRIKSSRVYETVKLEAKKRISDANTGMSCYIDQCGNRIRCSTSDSRVLTGELKSLSSGRKYGPRSQISRDRTSNALRGKKSGPMSVQQRLNRRKIVAEPILYYDPVTLNFIELDPLLAPKSFIKVFTNGKQVWDVNGKFRRVSTELLVPPPGWSFHNPKITYKIIDLDTLEYTECTGDILPKNYYKLSLCKNGKKLFYCTSLQKDIYIDEVTLQQFGIPKNCHSSP
jgi:hypothetical protein